MKNEIASLKNNNIKIAFNAGRLTEEKIIFIIITERYHASFYILNKGLYNIFNAFNKELEHQNNSGGS